MRHIFVIMFGLIVSSSTAQSGIEDEFSKAIQKGLTNSIKKYLSNFQERMPPLLTKPFLVESPSYSRQLTPAIIEKALYNLKNSLPETIPMIPFAVAEPTSSDILFYFGILNSQFINLTHFTCNATVNNTVSSSSIGVNFQVNTSSLEGHYELDVSSYDMHLYGDGDYRVISNGSDASVLTNIDIFMDGSFKMTDFLFNISISSAQLTMSNLLGGDPSAQKLTEAISETIPAEVVTLSDLVQQTVNSSVVDFTNSYVASMLSWSDVVELVYHLAEM